MMLQINFWSGIVFVTLSCVWSFKWHLSESITKGSVLTFSERFMFATESGPTMLEQGAAYIDINANILVHTRQNWSRTAIAYSVFAANDGHHHDDLKGMCHDTSLLVNDWASDVYAGNTNEGHYVGEEIVHFKGNNITYYKWLLHVSYRHTVNVEAWYNVQFQQCSLDSIVPPATLDAVITFRNPYGYLPGELYGILPFQGARMVAYVLFGVVYMFYYCRHLASALLLHHAILGVFLVALTEATVWYAAYQTINLTGEPYCCPFPSTVIAALVLQVLRQTFARCLLLVVSLGYGIARPKLQTSEWVTVAVVTVLYCIAALIAQVANIVTVNDVHNVASGKSAFNYQIPELFMDVLFLTWIFHSLSSTIRVLTEFQQTVKLALYKHLALVMVIFVSMFTFATFLMALDHYKFLQVPWQYSWLMEVAWESLNFAVLTIACIICLPSDTSRMLAYASQLPTEDPDDDDEDYGSYGKEMDGNDDSNDEDAHDDDERGAVSGVSGGRAHGSRTKNSQYEGHYDEDDSGDFELVQSFSNSSSHGTKHGTGNGRVSSKKNDFSTLPSAPDEEFGLESSDL